MLVSVSPGSGESTEQAWTNGLARAIDAIGDPCCPGFLIDAISALVDFDMAMSVVYSRRAKPVLVHDGFTDAEARLGLSNYIDNTYVLNPLYTAYCDGIEEGVYRINELAPDEYFTSDHYRTFKIKRQLSEEIGFVTDSWPVGMEEIVLAIELQDGKLGEIVLLRSTSQGGFSETTLSTLRCHIVVIGAIYRQFWQQSGAAAQVSAPATSIDDMLDRFGEHNLSPREREVAQLILKGHSGISIGDRLGISLTTVKSHRQNLYTKLGIASQFELFTRFLESLAPQEI